MRDQPRARGIRPLLTAAAALVACSALVSPSPGHAGEARSAEARKADYLFNFLKFVEWPHAPAAPLTLCFLGDSGVYEEVSIRLTDKRLGERPLIARHLEPAQPMPACHVLYIDAAHVATVSDLLVTRPTALLTVSDAPDFLKSGGIIALVEEGKRLRFRISVDNARRAALRISSSLLQLASAVEREG